MFFINHVLKFKYQCHARRIEVKHTVIYTKLIQTIFQERVHFTL